MLRINHVFVSKDQARKYALTFVLNAPRFTDDQGARKEGLPGMILPRQLQPRLLTKLVTDWLGTRRARLIRIGTTDRQGSAARPYADATGLRDAHPGGAEGTVELDVWEHEEAERLVIGTATVQFSPP